MAKEVLDSDRINYLIWRYVFPRDPLDRVGFSGTGVHSLTSESALLHRYLVESGSYTGSEAILSSMRDLIIPF